MIETKQLLVLQQIAQQQSVSKAAKQLNLSQPAISHILAKLETQAGGSLFDRSHKQMRLTALGQHCLNHAQPILGQLQQLQKSLQQEQQQCLKVRANCLHSHRWLPQVIKQYRQLLPEVNLQITNVDQGIQPLFDGSADIVINSNKPQQAAVVSEFISEAEIVLICAKNQPPSKAEFVTAKQLQQLDFVYYQELNLDSLTDLVGAEPVRFKSYTILDSMDTILELVASGYGVTAAPDFVVQQSSCKTRLCAKSMFKNKRYKTWHAHYLKQPECKKIACFVELLTAIA